MSKIDFGRVWGPFKSPLGSPLRHVGAAVELPWHRLGPKWSHKHQDEGSKSNLSSSRGGQGISEALNGSIWGRFSLFVGCYLVLWYVFVIRKVLCTQFATLTWILDVFAFISARYFEMAAASHCSCFSRCVGRGQGSAAGAAEDHMMCMVDASKCMGLYT